MRELEFFRDKVFYKILNEHENHNEFQYRDGINILKDKFATTGSCVPGGLYFTDDKNIDSFLHYGVTRRDITLPVDNPELKVVADPQMIPLKWRANMLHLGKRAFYLEDEDDLRLLFGIDANSGKFAYILPDMVTVGIMDALVEKLDKIESTCDDRNKFFTRILLLNHCIEIAPEKVLVKHVTEKNLFLMNDDTLDIIFEKFEKDVLEARAIEFMRKIKKEGFLGFYWPTLKILVLKWFSRDIFRDCIYIILEFYCWDGDIPFFLKFFEMMPEHVKMRTLRSISWGLMTDFKQEELLETVGKERLALFIDENFLYSHFYSNKIHLSSKAQLEFVRQVKGPDFLMKLLLRTEFLRWDVVTVMGILERTFGSSFLKENMGTLENPLRKFLQDNLICATFSQMQRFKDSVENFLDENTKKELATVILVWKNFDLNVKHENNENNENNEKSHHQIQMEHFEIIAKKLDFAKFPILTKEPPEKLLEMLKGDGLSFLTTTRQLENVLAFNLREDQRHVIICRAIKLGKMNFLKDQVSKEYEKKLGKKNLARYKFLMGKKQ
jgi:hypothetical protein